LVTLRDTRRSCSCAKFPASAKLIASPVTPEELDYIRTAAIGDMLGDSRAFDEMGASTVIFRLCVEIKKLRKERNENRALIRFIIGRLEAIAQRGKASRKAV
ncbi:hypothetical protein, partial [uncultured Bilophila sp.]|uniref:hypothetical protein n=1 Tax=uncultured Bilophila sp. TaxID=529385 RepID=UPI002597EE01